MKIYKLQTYPAAISYTALWKTHCPHPNHSRFFPLQGITHMWNTALFKHFSSQGTYFQTLTLFQTFSSSALSRNQFSPIRHVNVEWRYDSFPPTIFLAFHSVLLNKKLQSQNEGGSCPASKLLRSGREAEDTAQDFKRDRKYTVWNMMASTPFRFP